MPRRTTLVLVLLAAGGCSAHGGNTAGETRAAALGVVDAFNREDARATGAFDAPDYVGIFHGSANTDGPAADEAGMKALAARAKVHWQLGPDRTTVSEAGDIGIFEAPYTFVMQVPGAPATTEQGTWVAIFKRQGDGTMKLWRSIASDGPPAAPPRP